MQRLTSKQQTRLQEAKDIAREVGLDLDLNHLLKKANPASAVEDAIHKMVVSEIVVHYTALDEALAPTNYQIFSRRTAFAP